MGKLLKSTIAAFINSLIAMTLILAPIDYQGGGQINSAYAADEKEEKQDVDIDCDTAEDRNSQEGNRGVYKAGCEFNDDMAKSKMKDHYGEGTMGMIEQFIGAVFAMIGITAIATPTPNSIAACKGHLGAKVTFPIVAGGSLAYLIGEMQANAKFKEASKESVDHAFAAKKTEEVNREGTKEARDESRKTAKKNREENLKQIKAYEALEKIYQAQVDGMSTKVKMATAAEIAYLAAEGVELSDIISNNSAGNAEKVAALDAEIAAEATLFTSAGSLAGGTCGACSTLVASTKAYLAGVEAIDVANTGTAVGQESKEAVSAAGDIKMASSMFSSFTGFLTSMGGKVAGLVKSKTELAEADATATANDTVGKTTKTERLAAEKSLMGIAASCTSAATAGSFGTCSVGTGLLPAFNAAVVNLSAIRNIPLLCTSAGTFLGVDLDSITPPVVDISYDIDQIGLGVGGVIVLNDNFVKEKRRYVKAIFSNFLNRLAISELSKVEVNADKRVSQYAATSQYIEYIVEEGMKKFDKTNFEEEFKQLDFDYNDFDYYKLGSIFKKEFSLINSAHAGGIDFSEFLGLAVKIGLMYYTMSGYVREYAFPKSGNRAWTWAIMAVVNGAILAFDMKKKDEAKERLDVVRKEKEHFIKSRAADSGFSLDANQAKLLNNGNISMADATAGSYNGKGVMGCATPKGNSYAPAPCPTVIPKQKFAINTGKAKFIANGSPLKNALNSIPSVAYNAATGKAYSNPSMMDASIKSLAGQRNALVRQVASLRKKFDDRPAIKDKNGKPLKRASIQGTVAKFKKLYKGDPSKTGVSPQIAASINSAKMPDLKGLEDKVAALKPGQKSAGGNGANIPSFNMPSRSESDFDFDLDDEGGVGESGEFGQEGSSARGEEELGEFIVDSGEIVENEDVNIFKLISNRYLLSYPVLLEEKK